MDAASTYHFSRLRLSSTCYSRYVEAAASGTDLQKRAGSLVAELGGCWALFPCLAASATQVLGEPGEHAPTTATASYSLTVLGLTTGATYKLYRTTGLFEGYQVPQSTTALSSVCTAQGPSRCTSISFVATRPVMTFTQGSTGDEPGAPSLGEFAATR